MAMLVKYDLGSGVIVGVWESNNLALLEGQRVADDPVHGYLVCPLEVGASDLERDYIVQDGAVAARSARR